jgi:adenylyltransferase/sulfurtransferase
MNKKLNNEHLERYSRQIVLKDIGIQGQKKISLSKILIVGAGGLGCPAADYLSRAGVGVIGIADFDKVSLSNIHRQSMYHSKDIGKFKVDKLYEKIKKINPYVKINKHKVKISIKNVNQIVNKYDLIIDGTDNFKTKFLLNDASMKFKKYFIPGAISKFDGHVFTFNFKDKKTASLRDFYQEKEVSDDILNCEFEGVLGTTASIVGSLQASEALKMIVEIGKSLKNQILIIDLLNLNFRKVKFKKR